MTKVGDTLCTSLTNKFDELEKKKYINSVPQDVTSHINYS